MELSEEQLLLAIGYKKDSLPDWWICPDGYTRKTSAAITQPDYIAAKQLISYLYDSLGWRSGEEIRKDIADLTGLWNVAINEVKKERDSAEQSAYQASRDERVKIGEWLGQTLQDVHLGWDCTAQPLLTIAKGAQALKRGEEVK